MLRFAPSVTKDMNISDLRIAIFNYILSKQLEKPLLIRIDDLEKEKNIEGKDKEILELLNLFSIEYSNIIYQSQNLKYHQKLAMQLMSQKKAFACFCSENKLDELKEKAKEKGKTYSYDGFCSTLSDETVLNCNASFTVRISKPHENISFNDSLQGNFNFKPYEIDSFHILKQDKTPTYNYACAIDDMLSNISTVIRSDEHILNTPKQIYTRSILNYDKEIEYIHIPSIHTKHNENSVKSLIDKGFLPSAIANYLVFLGNEVPKEIFTLEEAIKWFDIKNISKESLNFDIDKLKEINKKHLETIDELRLSKILGFADKDIGKLAKLFLDDSFTIKEIKSRIDAIFKEKTIYKDYEQEYLKLNECLKNAPFISEFDDLKKYIIQNTQLEEKQFLKPLTYILTGQTKTSNISDIYTLIKNYLGEIIK